LLHSGATFKDIAFELNGKRKIHAMWHMITDSDLKLTYSIENADERNGTVRWVAAYTYHDDGTARKVHNEVRSIFVFKDELIAEHFDDSDALKWCMQALGPVKGFLAWAFPKRRRKAAAEKLDNFIKGHREYQ
jgi:hypothetical protein